MRLTLMLAVPRIASYSAHRGNCGESAVTMGNDRRHEGEPVRVFISYAHESEAHAEAVRDLWLLLRRCGVDARLDLTATSDRQEWTTRQFGTSHR